MSVDPEFLEERRRLGIDGFDEAWDGELHMNPPAGGPHQLFSSRFFLVLAPLASDRGLEALMETGVFRPDTKDDYRVPDSSYFAPELLSERGIEGAAALVIEVRSRDDETYAKLPFYAAVGVGELLVVHPDDRRAELYRFADGQVVAVQADPDRGFQLTALGVWVTTVATTDGPRLRVTAPDGTVTDI